MITDRQQAILDFINECVKENGFPPSVREIGRRFGIYPATVQDHISALERKGYLQKKRFQSRTLSIPGRRTSSDRQAAPGIPIVPPLSPLLGCREPLADHSRFGAQEWTTFATVTVRRHGFR